MYRAIRPASLGSATSRVRPPDLTRTLLPSNFTSSSFSLIYPTYTTF